MYLLFLVLNINIQSKRSHAFIVGLFLSSWVELFVLNLSGELGLKYEKWSINKNIQFIILIWCGPPRHQDCVKFSIYISIRSYEVEFFFHNSVCSIALWVVQQDKKEGNAMTMFLSNCWIKH